MKQFIILATAVVFFVISGCQKKTGQSRQDASGAGLTNDVIAELIKEDILSGRTNGGQPSDTNASLMESISGRPLALATETPPEPPADEKPLPEEPMIGDGRKSQAQDKTIRDKPIEVPEKAPAAAPVRKGTYLKIGNDRSGQVVTRKQPAKFTTVVFKPVPEAKYLDFWIYAIPLGRKTGPLLTHVRNIEIVNGQAQFTRYWNGKRISGTYINPGKYRITVKYAIKNASKKVIRTEYRTWGQNLNYYLILR